MPESVHRISVDGHKSIKIKTMTRNIAGVCVCSIPPSRVQLTSQRAIDLFSLYVLFSQNRSCDSTLENSPFKFHLIHVHISMHSLWKDKGSNSSELPWDLYWENKIYKLKRSIPTFSNVLVHVAVKNASNRLVGRLLIYAFSMTTKTHLFA